jgi:hypothetical protein
MQVIDSSLAEVYEAVGVDGIIRGPVGQLENDDQHWYFDPLDSDVKVPGCTGVLGATESKSWLANFAIAGGAEYVVNNMEFIAQSIETAGKKATIALIKSIANQRKDLKRDIGSYVHKVFEALILDIPIPDVPDHLIGVEIDGESVDLDLITDGLTNFICDFAPKFWMAEATGLNLTHGYGATIDAGAVVRRLGSGIFEAKTGNLYASARPQVAAQRRVEVLLIDDNGTRVPMPVVDFTAVLHINRCYRSGYKVFPLKDDHADWLAFLDAKRRWDSMRAIPQVAGVPLYPPLADGSQPLPLIEDITTSGFGRVRKPLDQAGVFTLPQLAKFTEADLLAIKNVGPASLDAAKVVLDQYGLSLRTEEVAG